MWKFVHQANRGVILCKFQLKSVKTIETAEEKLGWIFTAFDEDGGGFMDSDEVVQIVLGLFRLFNNIIIAIVVVIVVVVVVIVVVVVVIVVVQIILWVFSCHCFCHHCHCHYFHTNHPAKDINHCCHHPAQDGRNPRGR